MKPAPPSVVRWRLLAVVAAVVLAGAAAGLAAIWSVERAQRQDSIVPTILTVGLTTGLLILWGLVWLLFLSRLAWRARLVTLLAAGALGTLAAFSLKIRGFSGDVVPIFGWRWSRTGDLPPLVPAAVGARRRTTSAHDFPQFLGPTRDGRVPGVRLARTWASLPRAMWRRPVGPAWSGFAIAGDYAVTQEQRGEQELVTCYDLASGSPLWADAEATRWEDPIGGPGPRATPSIDASRVFALGGTGRLTALDLETGRRLWSVDVREEAHVELPTYGVSASPLVLDDFVVVAAGGRDGDALVAYDVLTGARRWAGGSAGPAYGSPRAATLAGLSQIVLLSDDAVAGHAASDGRLLWSFEWPSGTERTFTPLVLPEDRVFVSGGYGVGARLLEVRRSVEDFGADLVWSSPALKAKFTNVVWRDGFLYGLDDGILACVDAASGGRRWKGGRYGHGQTLLVDDLLLVLAEDGEVALVEAEPTAYRELGRFAALSGKAWNVPALAGPYLVVRNDREAACFELPLLGS